MKIYICQKELENNNNNENYHNNVQTYNITIINYIKRLFLLKINYVTIKLSGLAIINWEWDVSKTEI